MATVGLLKRVRRTTAAGVIIVLVAACAGTQTSASPSTTAGMETFRPDATVAASTPTLAPGSPIVPSLPAASGLSTAWMLDGRPLESCTLNSYGMTAEALCGKLAVPLDPGAPAGPTIDLAVAVIPAAGTAAADPLFAVAGGPGGASRDMGWLPGVFTRVHQERDIVLVDQRGTGASHQLAIAPLPDVTGLNESEIDAALADWADGYFSSIDVDPRFFTSTVAADDLDAVRAALGYETIDLYGPSYGGTLAQYYIRQHPDHVRAAVLDGSTPLHVPVLERMAANSQASLDLLIDECEKDSACRRAFPDLAAEWLTLEKRLEKTVTTDMVDPATGKFRTVTLDAVAPGLHGALRDQTAAPALPLAIHLAFSGQWQAVATQFPSSNSADVTALLMSDEILCSEAWARFDPNRVAQLGTGSYYVDSQVADARNLARLCRHIPRGVVPADDSAPVTGTTPILWITASGDPQDPPQNLVGVSGAAPSAIVVVPTHNHTVGHLGCAPSVIGAFLDAGTAAGLDTSCIADMHLPPFKLN